MRFFWLLQIAVILLAPPALYVWRHREDAQRALTGAALLLAGMYALFFGAFIVGEVFSDPGGWVAVRVTAAWVVPLVAMALLAWHRPGWAVVGLGVLLLGLVGVYAWSVAEPDAWSAYEDGTGPVRAVMAFALAAPMAVLGWKRPRAAGLMLLALPVLPVLLVLVNSVRGLGAQGWPIVLVTSPAAVVGVLLLLGGVLRKDALRHRPPGHPTGPGLRPSTR